MKTKLLLMLLVVGLAAGAAQANMLVNPSFEEGVFEANDPPAYWVDSYSSITSNMTWFDDADGAHTGSKYIKMNSWWSYSSSAYFWQTVDVTPDQEYAFGVWAKCPFPGETSKAKGYYEYLDSTGAVISEGELPWDWDVGGNWTYVEFGTATAPSSATRVFYSLLGVVENGGMGVLFDDAYMDTPLPSLPSPAWESLVPVGDVDLSWTNLPPNDPNDSVYADVLFGVDPNNPGNWEKIVDAVEDANSVTVEDLAIGTYYWQVNSYIYGDPATTSYETNPGDPNIIRGLAWSFDVVADAPPSSLDAGADMITWSGEAVQLDAMVEDDGESELDYAWSLDAPAGTEVLLSATDIKDPTVTINNISSREALIVNPSFEDRLTGWESFGVWNGTWDGWWGGRERIIPTDGDMCAYLMGNYGDPIEGAWISQTLAETLATETTYTLTVDVVDDGVYSEEVEYMVQLLAGETVVAEDDNSLPLDRPKPSSASEWATSTVVFAVGDPGPSDPNFVHVGQPLGIRLVCKYALEDVEMSFDNVHLTAEPPFPAPELSSVELTVAVNDEANPTYVLKDSITIDVYSDACAAAIGAGLSADNPGDIDGNCITNLEDLVLAVETWLNDTGLMEAVVRPAGPKIPSLYERWTGSGTADSMLTESSAPDYTEILTSTEWGVGDDDALSNYRGRITAWLIPPVTGDYIFWITTDDNGRLWLSTDHDPANATLVASVPGWAAENDWTKFTEQQSAPITLQGGRAYWLRGGYQEAGGGDHIRIGWASSKAGIADHTIIEGQYLSGTDPADAMRPSPADGGYVHPSDALELSWTNMDPNNPGDSVWVDVWFGTDPNDYNDFDKVVDATTPAGEDANSVTVDASTIGETYYWQVNSYLDGSPTGDPVEGAMWSFQAVSDIPVSVNAGDDMITWSGEPVELEPSIDDDKVSELTIAWSADPVEGTEVVFDPVTADIEAPDVTITAVPYSAAKIVNAGFEDPVLADGDKAAPSGWSLVDGEIHAVNPGIDGTDYDSYGGIAPEGDNIGISGTDGSEGGLAQVLTETLAADTTYELIVEVGRNTLYDWVGYKVQLLAGGTVLAEDDNSLTIVEDTFETSTVTYDSTGVDAGLVGQNLEIRLLALAQDTYLEVNFDDVRLTADPPFSPTWVQTVTLTVSAHDDVGSDEDTMTIDVYDNPCQAAIIGLGEEYDAGDVDADCDTDIEDYAEMALTWLVDYELTEPVVKP